MAKKATGAKEKEPATVRKKIYFYRANLGLDADGDPIPFDFEKVLAAVDDLDFETGGRYLQADSAGDVFIGSWLEESYDRMRLANVRRNGFPQVDRTGKLSALNLPAGAGLVKSIHVRFYPNNIVGAVSNFFGPRISRLAYYLQQKVPQHCASIRFNPILRENIVERLDDLEDIRVLDLSLLTEYQERLEKADGLLGASVQALIDAGNPKQVEIILRPKPRSRKEALKQRLFSSIRRIAKDPVLREGLKKFEVSGHNSRTGRVEPLDLLTDEFVHIARVEVEQNEKTKSLRDESAFAAIDQAYADLKGKIEHAPSIGE